jgi:hypothetical protein
LKIDVEGFELNVLKGIDFSSNARPVNIILEYTDIGFSYGGRGRVDLHDYLTKRGYRAFDITGQPLREDADAAEYNAWFMDSA